jgi:coatomer protein complex subunit gamma
LKQVPVSVEPITVTEKKPSALAVEPAVRKEEKNKSSRQDIYARKSQIYMAALIFRVSEQLFAIADFSDLGPLFRSSPVIELTEAVTEYNVSCVKHTFQEHVVLQVSTYLNSYTYLSF